MTGRGGAVAGLILAGGRGERLGGADKALVPLAGAPMAARVAGRLRPQVAALAISANGDPARLAFLGLPVLPDPPGLLGAGPLAGLAAGLEWAAAEGYAALATAACDTPFLPRDLVARLAAAAGPSGAAVAASPDAAGRLRRHPTCALWPVAARADLAQALAGGLRKLGLWVEAMRAGVAAFAAVPFDPFLNVNTPEDLARAVAIATAEAP